MGTAPGATSFLHTHHEVAGCFISVLSVIYAVILGFVVLVLNKHRKNKRTKQH